MATARIGDRPEPVLRPGARLEAEAAHARASFSPHLAERVLGNTLDALMWIADAAVVFSFSVDERVLSQVTMLRRARGHDGRHLSDLLARLPELEPIDPFSPRRAAACGATVMSAADVGGVQEFARSLHGQHLRRRGYGAPTVLFLRRAGAIVSGVTLLRSFDAPPFEPATIRQLRHFHPLVERALAGGAEPAAPTPQQVVLTAREAEIAGLVAGGASNARIADALGLREVTVKRHLTSVYAKLGVRSRTQLALAVSRPALRA
jgi:DNA-binding CsgD family transcriptional regulator